MRALILLAVVGCMEDSNPMLGQTSCTVRDYWQVGFNDKVDILLVIDDSSAMTPYLDALTANAPAFVSLVLSRPHPPDMRIAVAHGSNGVLVDPVPCGAQAGALWLEDSHHDLVRNFDGALTDAVTCLTHVGTAGGTQQPLASAFAALSHRNGFLRDDAFLFVAIITPQDDRSGDDPSTYYDALNALKRENNYVYASAITKPSLPRLTSFIYPFFGRGTLAPIDEASWLGAFYPLAPIPMGIPFLCVEGVLSQPTSCTFTRVQYFGTPGQQQIGTMPLCDPNGQSSGICAAPLPRGYCRTPFQFCYNGYDPSQLWPCLPGTNDPVENEVVVVECAVECQ